MKQGVVKKAILSGGVFIAAWFSVSVSRPLMPPSSIAEDEAAEWSEGVLAEIIMVKSATEREEGAGKTEIVIGGRNRTFRLDKEVSVKDEKGREISLSELLFPSRIRFSHREGMIREIVLIEVLPR